MKIIKLHAIDSTNTYLKQLAKNSQLEEETVVVAAHQFSGRGQMGNGWISKEGESLTFSIFKRFGALSVERQFMVSMGVSMAVYEALSTLNVPRISIKWPNDIMSANKKIGGILIENVLEGSNLKYSVIGIGLNVNEASFQNLPQASSLKLETGITFILEEVLALLLKSISKHLEMLNVATPSSLKQRYESVLFRKGMISVFEFAEGTRFNGIIIGVTDLGELLVETQSNGLQKFQLKEVKLIY